MPLEETMFSRAQMNVPAELPEILKQYTKAAIRTQPEKLLEWSAAYFTALKEGKPLPVKTRYEMGAATGLTFGILNILNRQLGKSGNFKSIGQCFNCAFFRTTTISTSPYERTT